MSCEEIMEALNKKTYDNRMQIRRLEMIVVELMETIRDKKDKFEVHVDDAEEYLLCEDEDDYTETWKQIFDWSEKKKKEEFENQDELGPEEEWDDVEDD